MQASIPQPVKGLILDMDGVLWRASQPLLDMPPFFAALKDLDIPVVFATNNGTRTVSDYLTLLASFGVDAQAWQIVNSAIATAEYLHKEFPQGGPVYIVAENGVTAALSEKGFFAAAPGDDPIAVVAGMDRAITYEKAAQATLLIRAGKPFIGTNPDLTFPIPAGQVPGAGAILALLEAASGVRPVMIGKPEPLLYRFAMERLGTRPEDTLAVGDRLETDILGGTRAGCPTVLVLSGVTSPAEAARWQPQPNLILPNLADLLPFLKQVEK